MSKDMKEQLLRRHTKQEIHKIEGVGEIRLRGLSRDEVLRAADMERGTERDAYTISCTMVDPAMTPEEVAVWFGTADSEEIGDVMAKAMQLSRIAVGSAKEVYREFEASPELEFRTLPGDRAEDDGGQAEAGAE